MSKTNRDSSLAELMKSEHEEIAREVQATREELESASCQRNCINDQLIQLSELIESHFRHEEQGGYMAEALVRAPQLRPRAEALQKQHEQLQEAIDKLQLLVNSGVESASWWDQIRNDFQHFASQLTEHEHCETKLVQEAYNLDIGGGD